MPKPKGKKKPSKPAGNQKQAEEEVVPSKKVFVGNLNGMDMTDAKLRQLFEAVGGITAVDLVNTSNHAFGFVEFTSIEEAELAIEKMNGENGLVVKFAKNSVPRPSAKAADEEASEETKVPAEDSEEEESQESEAMASKPDTVAITAAARTAAARAYPNPVDNLQEVVQKATRATSTKDHIIYHVEDADLDGFVATVEIIVPDGGTSHRGEPQDNKREAKKAAAKAALKDPAVHRLLPPLPPKVKEAEANTASKDEEDAEDAESMEESEDTKPGSSTGMSAKQQRQLEKEELRAKKLAKKRAAKAFKAALAAAFEEESEEEDEEDDEEEDDESEDSGSCEESEDSEGGIDGEALAAKKAAIKAALAAKRKAKGKRPAAASKEKEAEDNAKKKLDKTVFKENVSVDQVRESRLQANFGQTKFIKP